MKKILILGSIFGGCAAAFLLSYAYISQPSVATPNLSKRPPIDITALTAKAAHGDAQAQASLGDAYVNGDGVTNSYAEAAKWYRLAADQTNAAGQFGLGQLYEAGRGVPKDQTQAIKFYREAADQGLAGAQYTLGFLYEGGRGLPVNQTEAAKWYFKAAEQGDPLAQYDIGQRYDLGVGVAVDRVEALKWFILAANQGQRDSVARRDRVKHALSRSEIAEAERRATAISVKLMANPKN
jgi:TPR repeat protein